MRTAGCLNLTALRGLMAAVVLLSAAGRAYVDDFSAVLPGRKVARFYQIENKMDAVLRYELASRIPVVGEESTPPK